MLQSSNSFRCYIHIHMHMHIHIYMHIHIHMHMLQSSNSFRERYCYNERTSAVLRRHLPTLHALYTRYADVGDAAGVMGVRAAAVDRSLDSAELMSVTEWEAFLSHVGLFESKQLSASEVRHVHTHIHTHAHTHTHAHAHAHTHTHLHINIQAYLRASSKQLIAKP